MGWPRATSCLHQRGPEWREFSSGPPGGRTAHREHWELLGFQLGFQRKGVQASASPLSSWTGLDTTPLRTHPAGLSLTPPQKRRSQDRTPPDHTWMPADFLGLWTLESDSIPGGASASTGQPPGSAPLFPPPES